MQHACIGTASLVLLAGAACAQQVKLIDVIVTTDDGDSIVEEGESALICIYVQMTPPDDEVLCGFANAIFDTVNEQNADTGEITSFGCLNDLCNPDLTTTDGVNLFNTQVAQIPVFGPFNDSNPIGVYQFRWETDDYSQRVVKYRTITRTAQLWIGDCDESIVVDADVIEADIAFCVDSCTPFDVPDQLWGLPHEGGGIEFGFDQQGNPGFDVLAAPGEVLISAADADSHSFEFDPSTMPFGSLLSVIPQTAFPGGPPEPLWKHILKVDDEVQHFFDTSPINPAAIRLVALLNDKIVHEYMCEGCNFDLDPAFILPEAYGCIETWSPVNEDALAQLTFAEATLVMLPDAEVVADTVQMHAIEPGKPISPFALQTQIVCEGFEHFTLVKETVGKFGFDHISRDGAQMQACSDCLVISNIGASGDDGCEIDHKPAEFVEIMLEAGPNGMDPSFVNFAPTVDVAGSNNLKQLGLAAISHADNSWRIRPDFSAIGEETNIVEAQVMIGDVTIATLTGIVAAPPQVFFVKPTSLGFEAELMNAGTFSELFEACTTDMPVLVLDERMIPIGTADRVQFSLAEPVNPVESICATALLGANMEKIVITAETIVPLEEACLADCDDNGTLNILDFVCYQNLFTTGDLGADCDGNGTLNILDFVCFQNAFTAGCP